MIPLAGGFLAPIRVSPYWRPAYRPCVTRTVVDPRKPSSLVLWILTLTSAAASAQTLGPPEVFLSSGHDRRAISFLSAGETPRGSTAGMDYATFAYELIAFIAKEVLPDSHDEYPESPLGSRLSRDMAKRDSAFGQHCLTVVSQVGAALPRFSSVSPDFSVGSLSGLDDLLRVASTALALRQIWSAFENHVEDDRRGISLKPKVGAHKVGVSVTLHW